MLKIKEIDQIKDKKSIQTYGIAEINNIYSFQDVKQFVEKFDGSFCSGYINE